MTERPFVLDAYAARSCPLKTANAFGATPAPPKREVPPPAFFHDADAVEAEVFGLLRAGVASFVDLRALRRAPAADQEAAALRAIHEGFELIVGPLLPRDYTGHRSGRPSALLRRGGGYTPVVVKFHRVWESAGPTDRPQEFSILEEPGRVLELPGRRFRWGSRLKAALQAAHHWRLLEATGHAASEPVVGVIGTERLAVPGAESRRQHLAITWLDLAAPLASPNPTLVDEPGSAAPVSALERYDFEHDFRVLLAREAMQFGAARSMTPVVNRECRFCVWQEHCAGQLPEDELSKRIAKAPLDWHEVLTLRALGVHTVGDLAEADLDELSGRYLPRVSHRDGGEDRLRLAHRRARLLVSGVELERTTAGPIPLPPHDLEIDLDIETSADDHAYLWGFHVDDRATGRRYYQAFDSFADLDAAGERELAARAFGWLAQITQGRDAAVYHYSDYETLRVQRLAAALAERGEAALAEWVRGFAAASFVDLFAVVKAHFFGANGLGLKVVAAAAAGFAWRDEEPGGLASQSWFADAVHAAAPDAREAARTRVLQYNEDDVLATWHLRAWLRAQG